jgi:hypothetical protein
MGIAARSCIGGERADAVRWERRRRTWRQTPLGKPREAGLSQVACVTGGTTACKQSPFIGMDACDHKGGSGLVTRQVPLCLLESTTVRACIRRAARPPSPVSRTLHAAVRTLFLRACCASARRSSAGLRRPAALRLRAVRVACTRQPPCVPEELQRGCHVSAATTHHREIVKTGRNFGPLPCSGPRPGCVRKGFRGKPEEAVLPVSAIASRGAGRSCTSMR